MYPSCIWTFHSKWRGWVCIASAPTSLRHLPCTLLIGCSIQHLLKVPRKLHPLLHNIPQRRAQQLLNMLYLRRPIFLILHRNDILLQNVGKLDELSKFNSDFSYRFVVLIDSPCFVSFHHCTEFLMQKSQFLLHFLYFLVFLLLLDINFWILNRLFAIFVFKHFFQAGLLGLIAIIFFCKVDSFIFSNLFFHFFHLVFVSTFQFLQVYGLFGLAFGFIGKLADLTLWRIDMLLSGNWVP